MKKAILSLVTAALVAGLAESSHAQTKRSAPPVRQVSETSSDGGFWLGVALDNLIVKPTPAAAPVAFPGSITALLALNNKTAIQMYAAIYTVDPTFVFGVGGNIKFSVIGDNNKGFHLGGGFGLGTFAAGAAGGKFFANFAGTAGVHFQLVENVLVHTDMGPLLTVGTGTDFQLAARSILLGASILIRI